MVERVIRTLQEQCAHRHRFETLRQARRMIGDWISFYIHRWPHQALGMKVTAEAPWTLRWFVLRACLRSPEQHNQKC